MSNQENLDELSNDSVNDEILEEGEEGEETTPNKKNKSNFNSLYKKARDLEKSLTAKDEELANAKAELEEWRNLNPDADEEIKTKKNYQAQELRIFGLENPEAKPHLEDIQAVMKEYGINESKAWKLVKIDLPEESKTTTDFAIWKTAVNSKDLSKVSAEDALKLSPEKRREWRALHLG